MRKLGWLIAGTAVALTLWPLSASSVTLTITDATGSPSEIIQLRLLTTDFTGVAGAQIFIEFDTTKLEFFTMATSYIQSWTTNVIDDKILVVWEDFASPLTIPTNEPLFQFNLQAKPDAEGSAFVRFFGNIELVDNTGSPLDLTLDDATVTFIPSATGDDETVLPRRLAVAQNYPNPFNPQTIIDYTLARAGYYALEVYNISGQLVDRIELGNKLPGDYSLTYDAATLPSGVYLYRLAGDYNSPTRQMILLK